MKAKFGEWEPDEINKRKNQLICLCVSRRNISHYPTTVGLVRATSSVGEVLSFFLSFDEMVSQTAYKKKSRIVDVH